MARNDRIIVSREKIQQQQFPRGRQGEARLRRNNVSPRYPIERTIITLWKPARSLCYRFINRIVHDRRAFDVHYRRINEAARDASRRRVAGAIFAHRMLERVAIFRLRIRSRSRIDVAPSHRARREIERGRWNTSASTVAKSRRSARSIARAYRDGVARRNLELLSWWRINRIIAILYRAQYHADDYLPPLGFGGGETTKAAPREAPQLSTRSPPSC